MTTAETGAYLALQNSLRRLTGLGDDDWEKLRSVSRLETFPRLAHLAQAGRYSGVFWFIFQGLVRNYYVTAAGKEFNKSFIPAQGFCGSMREWATGQPSRFAIQALEQTAAVAIPMPWLQEAAGHSPAISRLIRITAEQLALKKELREAELLLDDATTRYLTFRNTYPNLEQRIPAYQVAAYLGITEVALSRIKRTLGRQS